MSEVEPSVVSVPAVPPTLSQLEEAILGAAEATPAAIGDLNAALAAFLPTGVPPEVRRLLADNLDLLLPAAKAAAPEAGRQLVLALAALEVEALPVRDALAAVCRQVYSSWPDPAGLTRALGIFAADVPLAEVRRRWDLLALLAPAAAAWHPSFGLGKIRAVDAFSNVITVEFARPQGLSLAQALTALAVAAPGSPFAAFLAGDETELDLELPAAEFNRRLAASFVPSLADPVPLARAVLVPGRLGPGQFETWQTGTEAAATTAAVAARSWRAARGLQELRLALKRREELVPAADGLAHLAALLIAESRTPRNAHLFADAVAGLGQAAGDAAWWPTLVTGLPVEAVAWSTPLHCAAAADKLIARRVPYWLRACLLARGQEWFLTAAAALPQRLWSATEDVLTAAGIDSAALADLCQAQLLKGTATPDAVLWLWRWQHAHDRPPYANLRALFRVFRQELPSRHNRAFEALQKLMLEDQEYLRALADGGTPEGLRSFVQGIRNESPFITGVRQSLLGKIVRLYPAAKDLVAEKPEVTAPRAGTKLSSYRSLHLMSEELLEINNKKIPANSSTIAHARGYGDLSENAEFKAAKEQQRLLMRRRDELERYLDETQPTDFSDVVITDQVVPGCTLELEVGGHRETHHLLGLWDSSPEEHILSYDTPLGRCLLGCRVGEVVTLPDGTQGHIAAVHPLSPALRNWVKVPD